ncbi:hypothetical protein I8751_17270 [Nostocaceae cyanobacterium CENA357]|uniref:Uncharacterized protein n=1 Tax=Atlanticothrix silvestris CENA357 TaxID=1725252 RepID=A0A8J7HG17_9CYAN|nr:hypothetical protein [Atlanticothrix silvestris CENA357]
MKDWKSHQISSTQAQHQTNKLYRQVDNKYRKFFTNYLEIFGYSDILLVSQFGDTVFSVSMGVGTKRITEEFIITIPLYQHFK